jgi:hypothetical protein
MPSSYLKEGIKSGCTVAAMPALRVHVTPKEFSA